jgi:hypothetical protein
MHFARRIRIHEQKPTKFTDKIYGYDRDGIDDLAGPEMVRARVVDMKGGVISRLVDRRMESGMHTLRWPENGRGIAPGTYFIQLEINRGIRRTLSCIF